MCYNNKKISMTKLSAFLMAFVASIIPTQVFAEDGYASSWQLGLQVANSPIKKEIHEFHNLLLIIITAITLVVTALLAWVVVRYRKKDGKKPAAFAHNTIIEIIWTIVPVIILIVIAIPSIRILYMEDRIPEPELTIKTTGYQWYWGYEYMDYDGLEFLAYPIADEDIDTDAGQKRLLSTDNPVVVPINTNIQILVTAGDVLHAFALPSAGIKRDAVPGRLNETWMRLERTGTYYGQCSEICGTGHAYMPIEIKAVEKEEFEAWTKSMGGTKRVDNSVTTMEDSAANMLRNEKVDADNIPGEITPTETNNDNQTNTIEQGQ
jgi:cytochrome c oxidase subunit 2